MTFLNGARFISIRIESRRIESHHIASNHIESHHIDGDKVAMETFDVDGYAPDVDAFARVGVMVFNDVRNPDVVRAAVMEGTIDAAVLDGASVAGARAVHMACYKARVALERNALATKALHAEVVYCLSPGSNIREALKRFGARDASTSIVVCKFDPTVEDEAMLRRMIDGNVVTFENKAPCDEVEVKKWYNVHENELAFGSLEDAVLSRIAIRDVA